MFSKEQVETLYLLVEKGVVTAEAVNTFLKSKLAELGLVEPVAETPAPETPAPETLAEPAPPVPEVAPAV